MKTKAAQQTNCDSWFKEKLDSNVSPRSPPVMKISLFYQILSILIYHIPLCLSTAGKQSGIAYNRKE